MSGADISVIALHQEEITHPMSGRLPLPTHDGVLLQHGTLQVTLFPEFGSNEQSDLQQEDTHQSQAPAQSSYPCSHPTWVSSSEKP